MKVESKYRDNCKGFGKFATFYHSIYRYFGKFPLQGVNKNWRQSGFFYLAPSLTLRGRLLVKVDFSHCGPYLLWTLDEIYSIGNKSVGHERDKSQNRQKVNALIKTHDNESRGQEEAASRLTIVIKIYVKTHDSESRGQEEAAVRDE